MYTSSPNEKPHDLDAETSIALEAARTDPNNLDPSVTVFLDRARLALWDRLQAQPDTYILTADEFALFNYFLPQFRDIKLAQAALQRFWDNYDAAPRNWHLKGSRGEDEQLDTSECRSVLSENDTIFSDVASSTTPSETEETRLAKDELFITLSSDLELSSLYKSAFLVMSGGTFEGEFVKLLKIYCVQLTKDAKNDLEKTAVRFMRPRSTRIYIANRVSQVFGPEERRRDRFAELTLQRSDKLPLLERFLNGIQSSSHSDREEIFDGSDEDIEVGDDNSFPNVKLLNDFLFGPAFSALQTNLRKFVDSYCDKVASHANYIASFGTDGVVDSFKAEKKCTHDNSYSESGQTCHHDPVNISSILAVILSSSMSHDVEKLRPWISKTPNFTSQYKNTDGSELILSWAAGEGRERIVRLFLSRGAEVNCTDKEYQTPLSRASFNEHEAIVRLLLQAGADVNSADGPLSRAVRDGHQEIVRLLLETGADVNAAEGPLLRAARSRNQETVRLLLETGADGSSTDGPLIWAAKNGNQEMVGILLRAGADANGTDREFGQSPLSWAAENGHEAVVRLLLGSGADIDQEDSVFGQSPLSWAAEKGHEAVVRLLLGSGADIDKEDSLYGQSPLSWAAENGHDVVVQQLLEKGAHLNRKDKMCGHTPLVWARKNGNENVVQLLLAKGAQLHLEGKTHSQRVLLSTPPCGDEAAVRPLMEGAALSEIPASSEWKKVILRWKCKCGKSFQEDVLEKVRGAAEELLAQTLCDSDDYDVERQDCSSGWTGTDTPSTGSSRAPKVPLKSTSASSQKSEAVTTVHEEARLAQLNDKGKWILLCMPGRGCDEVKHANVKSSKCNRDMYQELHDTYYSGLSSWLRWMSMRKIYTTHFVRFHVFYRTLVAISPQDLGSLPPPSASQYEFLGPMLVVASDHDGNVEKEQQQQGNEHPQEGWGLLVREVICWNTVFLVFTLLGIGALVFAVVWCVRYNHSIQDGFTVTGVLLAYGTIGMGLLQGVAMQNSVTRI